MEREALEVQNMKYYCPTVLKAALHEQQTLIESYHGLDDGTLKPLPQPQDVVLYGFGRIGRLLARILIEKAGSGSLRLRAIVVRRGKGDDLVKRASLLRRDSVHGTFRGTLTVDAENEAIIANGNNRTSAIYDCDINSINKMTESMVYIMV